MFYSEFELFIQLILQHTPKACLSSYINTLQDDLLLSQTTVLKRKEDEH